MSPVRASHHNTRRCRARRPRQEILMKSALARAIGSTGILCEQHSYQIDTAAVSPCRCPMRRDQRGPRGPECGRPAHPRRWGVATCLTSRLRHARPPGDFLRCEQMMVPHEWRDSSTREPTIEDDLAFQSWPRLTLLVKSRQSISNAKGVRSTRGMASVSLAFKCRVQDRLSVLF
jgi:hypothetical protein